MVPTSTAMRLGAGLSRAVCHSSAASFSSVIQLSLPPFEPVKRMDAVLFRCGGPGWLVWNFRTLREGTVIFRKLSTK
eukprot:3926265-Prymnesium_polylepis.1